jgi:hypothetical protein
MQGPTPIQLPGDQWTQWEVTPSNGGRSGRRTSDVARYNPEAGLMQVRFTGGGRGGVPNTYQYSSIDAETWDNFLAGRWSENGAATSWFLNAWAASGSNLLMPVSQLLWCHHATLIGQPDRPSDWSRAPAQSSVITDPLRASDRSKTGTHCSSDAKRLYALGFRYASPIVSRPLYSLSASRLRAPR